MRLALKEIKIKIKNFDVKQAFEFAQEATNLAMLSHPNIIKYHDSFLIENHPSHYFYIITELCEVRILVETFIKKNFFFNFVKINRTEA